jgi:hypothetical protein
MNTLWRIAKDALQAFIFWIVASLIAIYFLGYAGHVISLGLGFLLVVCFCILRALDLLVLMGILRRRGSSGPPGGRPAGAPLGAPVGNSVGRPCPNCSGGSVTCSSCAGSGSRYVGGDQPVLCSVCAGQRFLTCNTCSGSGRVYW